MNKSISGKVVVITGASSWIGEATARLLGAQGAYLVLGSRHPVRLKALSRDIIAYGGNIAFIQTDVSKRTEVEALILKAVDVFGRIDVLINNASIMPDSRLDQLRIKDWERTIDVNLKGTLYSIAAALPIMKMQKNGLIITMASLSWYRVRPLSAVYPAAKFDAKVLSGGLRMEMPPWSIRRTIISPGPADTDLPVIITDDYVARQFRKLHELAISPETLAETIAFIISQPASVDINEILLHFNTME